MHARTNVPRQARATKRWGARLVVVTLALSVVPLAVSIPQAGAANCWSSSTCDSLWGSLYNRAQFLNSANGANAFNKARYTTALALNEARRHDNFGAQCFTMAAQLYLNVIGDNNRNGSKDLDEANFYLAAYAGSSNHLSGQSQSWLTSAETIVKQLEGYYSTAEFMSSSGAQAAAQFHP